MMVKRKKKNWGRLQKDFCTHPDSVSYDDGVGQWYQCIAMMMIMTYEEYDDNDNNDHDNNNNNRQQWPRQQ